MNEEKKEEKADVKNRVMEGIKSKKIKMRSRLVFLAEKLGLEGALVLAIVAGILIVSLLFYFIKNLRLDEFLSMGMSGTGVFFATLPYDYVLLFIGAVALAIYFANRVELCRGKCERTDAFAVWFFLGALVLGIFFGSMGLGEILGGWSHKKIPHDRAIHGQVENFSADGSEATVIDDDGLVVRVFSNVPPMPDNYSPGAFLRAVGHRDQDDPTVFHADKVRCCDDD